MGIRMLLVLGALAVVQSTIYFKDTFEDESWEKRWIHSTSKPAAEAGKFKLSAGKFYGDPQKDLGIQTSEDAKFYQLSTKFDKFSNDGKKLILQFSVKHEQNIDCGGGYIKLFPSTLEPEKMSGDSPYHIMFGPDICGPGTKKVHVIFTYKGKNLLIKKDIRCKDDEMTHLYTLIVNFNNTYEVRIDNEKEESGQLEADWDFLAPKNIKDPTAKKPEDWVDTAQMDDPEDTKPDDFDEPELIPDKDAKKPDDWDDEEDGEWEPPMVNNPEYKGEWKPKQIDNPLYKGEWVHPEIVNPDYKADENLYKFDDIGHIGFEIWQVKSGTIFDNIIVTDEQAEADAMVKVFEETKKAEKVMKDKVDEEDRKKREEEEKKEKKDKKEDDDEDDDDDEKDDDKEDGPPPVVETEESDKEPEKEPEEAEGKDEL